jgi:hypothetical protein
LKLRQLRLILVAQSAYKRVWRQRGISRCQV